MSTGELEGIIEVLRLHGVDARDRGGCVGVEVDPGVHVAFNLEKRLVSIYDLARDVHLTYPLSVPPQGMPDYERWLREVNTAKETWRRVLDVLPGWLRG